MSEITIGRSRTTWDVILGILLIIGGLVILGNAVVATTVSVLFLGWMLLIAGIFGLAAAVLSIRHGNFLSSALIGGLLTVLGLMFLRHTHAAATTLTLIAGTLFLSSGVFRLIMAADAKESRLPLLLSGAVSTILGLIVLFNLFDVSYAFLGVLLGIEMLADGIMLVLLGRLRVTAVNTAPAY